MYFHIYQIVKLKPNNGNMEKSCLKYSIYYINNIFQDHQNWKKLFINNSDILCTKNNIKILKTFNFISL